MKKKMTKVEFERVEGPIDRAGKGKKLFTTWKDVEKFIKGEAITAPEERQGYDKCDFKVYFEDGFEYGGRLDLDKGDKYGTPLTDHILNSLSFQAGYKKPYKWTPEQYEQIISGQKEIAKEILDTYQIGEFIVNTNS